jgi:hypothetical protein
MQIDHDMRCRTAAGAVISDHKTRRRQIIRLICGDLFRLVHPQEARSGGDELAGGTDPPRKV